MSKLRELSNLIKMVGSIRAYLERSEYLETNADAIADLIDEAKGAHADCNIIRCEVCAILERMGEK